MTMTTFFGSYCSFYCYSGMAVAITTIVDATVAIQALPMNAVAAIKKDCLSNKATEKGNALQFFTFSAVFFQQIQKGGNKYVRQKWMRMR